MEPLVAGGLVLGLTFGSLVFVGLCNAAAEKLYSRFFEPRKAGDEATQPRADPQQRRSA